MEGGSPFLAQSLGQTQGSPLKCGEALEELCSGLFSLSAGLWHLSGGSWPWIHRPGAQGEVLG